MITNRTGNAAIAVLLVLTSVVQGKVAAPPKETSVDASPGEVIQQVGISPRLGEKVPLDAEFHDHTGKKVRLGDVLGDRPTILHLMYYECPMLCKLSGDGLLSTLSTLSLEQGEDFSVVTLSFDPREGPELSARARQIAIARSGEGAVETGWTFLTGDQQAIKRVTDAVGFRYVWDDRMKQYAHAAGIFIVTPDGTISRYLGGIEYAPRDLRLAIVEASDGKVGTLGDQVKLMCYMYDPTVGKYGFAIMSIIRVAGLTTVGGIAASIVMMLRREKRMSENSSTREAPGA